LEYAEMVFVSRIEPDLICITQANHWNRPAGDRDWVKFVLTVYISF